MVKKHRESTTQGHSVFQCRMSSGGLITPSILNALIDKNKRPKLERLAEILNDRKLLDNLYYGVSGLTFKDISELLDAINA